MSRNYLSQNIESITVFDVWVWGSGLPSSLIPNILN
jgi:hypothetical protein